MLGCRTINCFGNLVNLTVFINEITGIFFQVRCILRCSFIRFGSPFAVRSLKSQTCGRSVITLNSQRRRTVFVEDNLQFLIFAVQKVNALVAGVFCDTVNLFQNFVELFHVVFNRIGF